MLSVRCLSVLSPVCDVRALWPNGWTDQGETCPVKSFIRLTRKTILITLNQPKQHTVLSTFHGMQVGLGPGHIVLGWDRAPPALGHSPPIFGPYLLRPNGCMDQDVTWYGGRPRPRRLCVRWGSRSPSPKGGWSPPIFRPVFIVAKRLDGSRRNLACR